MSGLRIIVGAALCPVPFSPGMAWDRMDLVSGLRALGHDVLFVEEIEDTWLTDELGRPSPYEHSANRRRFLEIAAEFGLGGRACQLLRGSMTTAGIALDELVQFGRSADLLINVSGHVQTAAVLEGPRVRAYVDQDPVYTQLWSVTYNKDLGFANHDVFFTVGLNIGTDRSPIPSAGIAWHHLLPGVMLDHWPTTDTPAGASLTTVASWTGYGDVEHQGIWYRSKYAEFERFARLPRRVRPSLEVLLKPFGGEDDGIRLLRDNGWHVVLNGGEGDMDTYRRYIAGSIGEIGIAKHAYVEGRSGWFSDRSARYLASGRPVVAQATGFEDVLPVGAGLLAFRDEDEAVAAIAEIDRNHRRHAIAAREFAAAYLDHRSVLPRLLEVALGARHPSRPH